jgi:hypothetical protein
MTCACLFLSHRAASGLDGRLTIVGRRHLIVSDTSRGILRWRSAGVERRVLSGIVRFVARGQSVADSDFRLFRVRAHDRSPSSMSGSMQGEYPAEKPYG